MKLTTILTGIVVFCLACPSVFSVQVQWIGNGHYYEVVDTEEVTWDVAKAHAEAKLFMGYYGHLVTITSAEEQQFVAGLLSPSGDGEIWLGGYQPQGSPEPDGGWIWVTGETWSYQNWDQIVDQEPNDSGQAEDHLAMWIWDLRYPYWNDVGGYTNSNPYIVEYPIPEPSLAILLVGVVALRRWRI